MLARFLTGILGKKSALRLARKSTNWLDIYTYDMQSAGISTSGIHQQRDLEGREKSFKHDHFRIRQMVSPSEVSLMLEWVTAEGWNPGVYDAVSRFRQDPTGLWLAELDGVPIGAVSHVKYGERIVFGERVIIKPAFRGKGYLQRLLSEVLPAALKDRNVLAGGDIEHRLHGTYERVLGAKAAWYNSHFRGVGTGNIITQSRINNNHPFELVSIEKVEFEQLCTFDEKVFGAPRAEFLRHFISQPEMVALAAVSHDDARGRVILVVGYGCIRPCLEPYSDVGLSRNIGPLFAESAEVGSQLFAALVATVPKGTRYYVEIPELNENGTQIAMEYDLELDGQTVQMFTKGNWGMQCSMIYALGYY